MTLASSCKTNEYVLSSLLISNSMDDSCDVRRKDISNLHVTSSVLLGMNRDVIIAPAWALTEFSSVLSSQKNIKNNEERKNEWMSAHTQVRMCLRSSFNEETTMQFDSNKLNKTRFDGTLGIISQVFAVQKLQNKCLSFPLKCVRFSVLKFKVPRHDHQ